MKENKGIRFLGNICYLFATKGIRLAFICTNAMLHKGLFYNIIYTSFLNKTTLVATNYTPTTPTLLKYKTVGGGWVEEKIF